MREAALLQYKLRGFHMQGRTCISSLIRITAAATAVASAAAAPSPRPIAAPAEAQSETQTLLESASSLMDSDPQRALQLAARAAEIADATGDIQTQARAHETKGLALASLERPGEATKDLDRSARLFERLGDRRATARTLQQQGRNLGLTGRLWPSIDLLERALAVFRELDDQEGVAETLQQLGVNHMRAGEFQEAQRLSLESLRIARLLRRDELIAGNLSNIGEIHSTMGEHRIARGYYLQALPIWEKAHSPLHLADCLLCLGGTYMQTGGSEEALRHYERARSLAHAAAHARLEANARTAIASVHEAQGRLGDALRELQAVLPTLEEIGDITQTGGVRIQIARIHLRQGRLGQARTMLEPVLALAQESGSSLLLADTELALADVGQAAGDYRLAYEHLQRYSRAQQAIMNTQRNEKVAQLRERYEAETRRNEIQLLTANNELLRKDAEVRGLAVSRFRTIAALATTVALVVMGGLVLLLRRFLYLLRFWRRRSTIGHYRLLDRLGSGGMGVIYRAVDLLGQRRTVALKLVREEHCQDEVVRRRFLHEAALADQLEHPHIVKVVERGESGGRLFMAMELLEGHSLAERIARGTPIPLDVALRIMAQLASAVAKIHERGIVHRDLKPDNVMFATRDGDDSFVKLLDFGLARSQTLTRMTEAGTVLGTVSYLAPEQILARSETTASDVYSLGVTFYEIATLERPFPGAGAGEVVRATLEAEPIPPTAFRPDLPEPIERLLLSMIHKKTESRPTAAEVAGVIEALREKDCTGSPARLDCTGRHLPLPLRGEG